MKKAKEGKLRLSSADLQVANYVFTNYAETVAVQDINSTIIVKLSKRLPVARLVEGAILQRDMNFLHNFATMAFYVNGVVPDVQFWKDMNECIEGCISRHPELYGQKKEMDDAAEAEIIHDEKEFHEAMEELRAHTGDKVS